MGHDITLSLRRGFHGSSLLAHSPRAARDFRARPSEIDGGKHCCGNLCEASNEPTKIYANCADTTKLFLKVTSCVRKWIFLAKKVPVITAIS